MLDRLVQHPEHDREPANQQVNTTVSNKKKQNQTY